MLAIYGLMTLAYGCSAIRQSMSEEEQLLAYIFKDYNPSARPVINSSETVNVNLQFSLLQIQELNVRNQILTTTGLLILDWKDERLTWDKEIYGQEEIVVDGKSLWKPEFAVINGAEQIYREYNEFQAVIHPDGAVRWEPGGVFKTMCRIDITYYPFDEQKCELLFGAWSYYTTKMNLTTQSSEINMDTYEANGEWHIKKTEVQRQEFSFTCCVDQKFSNIAFIIHMRRRHTFYIMNVILPGLFTSAVLLAIFFCTPSQKVHIGSAAILSFRLFLLNVADTIPRTSDHVPLLGVYLSSTLAITTGAIIATTLVSNLYEIKDKPVPKWARDIIIVYLSRLLCMCECSPVKPPPHSTDSTCFRSDSQKHDRVGSRLARLQEPSFDSTFAFAQTNHHRDDVSNSPSTDGEGSSSNVRAPPFGSLRHRAVGFGVTGVTGRKSNREDEQASKTKKLNFSKDWANVANVCDRFFFWLCLVITCVTTALLFYPLMTSDQFRIAEFKKKTG